MESSSADVEESAEDIPGRKKSKFKSLRTRLFGRSKRTGGEGSTTLSQSASDVTAGKGLGSEEDLICPQGMMGSRALSHDSIFLADLVLVDPEPARVSSQDNVNSRIKALQMKLQQQKMHLGPPPLVLPIRRPEDLGSHLVEDSLPRSIPTFSGSDVPSQGSCSKTISQPSSRPLSPIPKPALTKHVPPIPFHPSLPSIPSTHSVIESPLDLSSPAQYTPCLDTSAARHRMSVKPRNQRASSKKKPTTTHSRLHSNMLNNVGRPDSVEEEEPRLCAPDMVTLETDQGESDILTTAQPLPLKCPEVAPVTSGAEPRSSRLPFSKQEPAPPGRAPSLTSQILRLKPQRPADGTYRERPHSSFIESELKSKIDRMFETQVMSHDKRTTLKNAGTTDDPSEELSAAPSSEAAFGPSSVRQQLQEEIESTRGIKRLAPGSGSFHFSINTAKNQDEGRPRSSSFVGKPEQAEARHKTIGGKEDTLFASLREKEDNRDVQPRARPFTVGRLKRQRDPPRSSVLPSEWGDGLKKIGSVISAPKTAPLDIGVVAAEVAESSKEEVEEAVEAQEEVQEEEGKTAFGITLRSTSQSMKLRSDASPNLICKPPACEGRPDKQNRQEIGDNLGSISKKLPSNVTCAPSTPGDIRVTDLCRSLEPNPSGFCLPVKNNLPSTGDSHIMSAEVQATSSRPREAETALTVPQQPEPAPQAASSEVSWMSLAMEKTRGLQQLFTSRFPRDSNAAHTVPRSQARVQPLNQTETGTGGQTQTQTIDMQQSSIAVRAANQPSTDTVNAATVQSASPAHAVKPPPVSMQQKTSAASSGPSKAFTEAQTSKQSSDSQSHPNATQSPSHPPVYSKPWTNQAFLRSVTLSENPSQSDLSSGQHAMPHAPWSQRGLNPTNPLKATTSVATTSSLTGPPPLPPAAGRGERDANVQEVTSLSGRRAVWSGSVSERAVFMEKRVERTTPTGTKELEMQKPQTAVQTSDESPVMGKTTPPNTDTKPEGRQESSPTEVPDKPPEEKWLWKNTAQRSPSSSPTPSSVLQSMSDSGQPSWMELAKRKSMAWSDKSME